MKLFFVFILFILSCASTKIYTIAGLPFGVNSEIDRIWIFPALNDLKMWRIDEEYWERGDSIVIIPCEPNTYLLVLSMNGNYYKLSANYLDQHTDSLEFKRLVKDLDLTFDSPEKLIDWAAFLYARNNPVDDYKIVNSYKELRDYWQRIYQETGTKAKVKGKYVWDWIPLIARDSIAPAKIDTLPEGKYQITFWIATASTNNYKYCWFWSNASLSRETVRINQEGNYHFEKGKYFWEEE